MDRDAVVEACGAVLGSHALRLAVLFGSAARDALRADSDVDIGIVPRDPSMSLSEELGLQASLERSVRRSVDLVRLDRASILLCWRVAKEGVLLFAAPPNEWPRFVARAGLDHAEFAPLYARAAEGFRRRLESEDDPR